MQELRGLEVEREALLFQVDVLQDTLESVEELLAEAQRDAGQANLVPFATLLVLKNKICRTGRGTQLTLTRFLHL